jgi:hypothetical protein
VSCLTDLLTDKGRFETLIFKLWFSGSFVRFGARSATMFRQHPYVFSILLVTTTFRSLRLLTCFFTLSGDPLDPPFVFGFVAAWLPC